MRMTGGKALALSVAAAAEMTACTRTLDMDTMKRGLTAGLNSKLGVQVKDVARPQGRQMKEGDSFQ